MTNWQTPKTDWATNPKNPVAEDFNRIEGNIDFLKQDIETKKGLIVDAINDMNQPAQVSDTHAQLASKIRDISKDATAAVGDVEKGKTFYAGGQKRTGTLELTGDAGSGDVLTGKTFYNTDLKTKRTGTMPNQGAVIITPSTSNQTIQAGYHSGQGYVRGDPNLKATNITEGVSIFGVAGSMPRVIEISDKMAMFDLIDFGNDINALVFDGTYLYIGGDSGSVWKINPSNMSKVAESAIYSGYIGALVFDGTYLYAGLSSGKRVRKINPSNMSLVAESVIFDGNIYALAFDGTYLYAGGEEKKVLKIDPSNMSKVAESAQYGSYIRALAFDGTYLYAGGSSTRKVWKINPSNMSKVAESADYGGDIGALAFDGTYLYAGGSGGGVWKINPSNMSKVAESAIYSGYIGALAFDGTYLYAGGSAGSVWKIGPSNMSKVAESAQYGSYIRALAFDGTYLYAGGSGGGVWKMLDTVYRKEA